MFTITPPVSNTWERRPSEHDRHELADQHDEWIIGRRYLSEHSMATLAACHTGDAQPGELQPAT